MVDKIKKRLRLWVQVLFLAVTNGYIFGFIEGKIYTGSSKSLCLPGLNCYSCPGALGSCPIGSLQAIIGNRDYKVSFYVIGFLMFFGSIFGRFICGWLCPFGLIQDLLNKIPFPFKCKNLPGHKVIVWLKYVILVAMVILLPLFVTDIVGQGSPWFCKYLCPSGTLFAGLPLVFMNEPLQAAVGWIFTWKLLILLIVVMVAIVVYRPFCKYLCPLGAIYGLFNKVSFFRMNVDDKKCIKCNKCKKVCKMDISVFKSPNNIECIRCGDCIKTCPVNAISKVNIIRREEND